jgi:adenylyl cyclase-associated protein
MRSLIAYIRQHQQKGIQWNPQGVPSAEAIRLIKSSPTGMSQPPPTPPHGSPSPSGGAPLPPPMPAHLAGGPPPPPPPGPPASRAPAGDIGAVFAELNQGSAITSGLKKVDPSQMTHKNPSLRAAVPVPARSSSQSSGKSVVPPGKKPKPESMRTKKPPKKELDGNKWIIVSPTQPSSFFNS